MIESTYASSSGNRPLLGELEAVVRRAVQLMSAVVRRASGSRKQRVEQRAHERIEAPLQLDEEGGGVGEPVEPDRSRVGPRDRTARIRVCRARVSRSPQSSPDSRITLAKSARSIVRPLLRAQPKIYARCSFSFRSRTRAGYRRPRSVAQRTRQFDKVLCELILTTHAHHVYKRPAFLGNSLLAIVHRATDRADDWGLRVGSACQRKERRR